MSAGPHKRRPRDTERIAAEQKRVARIGAYGLLIVGVALFATGTTLLFVNETLMIEALLCLEVSGLACVLLGLKKVRDLRDAD